MHLVVLLDVDDGGEFEAVSAVVLGISRLVIIVKIMLVRQPAKIRRRFQAIPLHFCDRAAKILNGRLLDLRLY